MEVNKNRPSFFRLFQLIVLVAWIVAFWFLLQHMGGSPLLGKFLRPDYWWLVEAGTAILVFFVISLVYSDPHNRGTRGVGLILQMGIMILPLLYLPTAAVSKFSPEAVEKRSFLVTQPGKIKNDASSNPWAGAAPDDKEASRVESALPRDPSLLRLVFEAEPYEGKRIETAGMVYTGERLPQNTFFCFQLLMFCCAADARPLGVLVEYDKSQSLEKGSWVKIEGTVGFTTFEDQRFTKISAEKVTPTETPKNPYLMP